MEDLKHIIAKNISDLRIEKGLTQLELAEKLNYSDKAISKWERGESIPNIIVLKEIADLFDISLDYLVSSEHPKEQLIKKVYSLTRMRNHAVITGMSILLVWLIATIIFVIIDLTPGDTNYHWLSFVYAVPVSVIVWLIFNSIWFDTHRNHFIISILMWTFLAAIHTNFLMLGYSTWLLFALGIPGQIIIFMWSKLKYDTPKNRDVT